MHHVSVCDRYQPQLKLKVTKVTSLERGVKKYVALLKCNRYDREAQSMMIIIHPNGRKVAQLLLASCHSKYGPVASRVASLRVTLCIII